MKCLYCHESIDPSSDSCPQCGLPLNRDLTLMGDQAPPRSLRDQLRANLKPILMILAVGLVSGGAGLSIGWATAPRAAASAPAAAPAAAGYPLPTPDPSRQPVGAPTAPMAPLSQPPAVLTTPVVSAAAEPVISPAVLLTEPLEPVRRSAEYRPQVRWGYRPGAAARPQTRSRPAPQPEFQALPPSHTLAVNPFQAPQQPYVYVSPILATMGDVTVQISPNRPAGTRSF